MNMPPPPTTEYSPPMPKKNNTTLIVLLVVAIGGICLCVPILGAILLPVFSQARLAARTTMALSHAKLSATGLLLYEADYDDKLPLDGTWMDAVSEYHYDKSIFKSPAVSTQHPTEFGFAFNKTLAGKIGSDVEDPDKMPLVFDSLNTSWNATEKLDTMPNPGRYRRGGKTGNIVSYLDSFARFIPDGTDPMKPSN